MPNSAVVGVLRALLVADSAEFDKALKRTNDDLKVWSRELKKTGREAAAVGEALTKSLTLPIAGLGLSAAKMAMDFETSFANVAKTVGGGKDQLDALAMTMRNMAKTIPLTTDELNKIAALGGQLGVSIENLADFTRHVAMLGVAVDGLSTEEAATSLAQIGNAAGTGTRDIAQMASTLVHLGNNSAATEAQILEFTKRLVGAGTSIGLTVREVMALGTAMANVGINAEAGGSAMSKVLADIGMAVSQGGAALTEFAKVANMSGEQFAATFKRAPMEAIQAFVNGLGTMKARGVDLNLTMADLSETGIRTRDTLTRLAGGVEGFNKAVKDSAVGWTTANKHITEAEIKFKTTANQLKLLWSQIRDVGITIGNAMLPAINFLIKAFSALTPILAKIGDLFAHAPVPLQLAALAIAAVAAAAGPLIYLFGQLLIASSAVTGAFAKQGIAARTTAASQAVLGTSSATLTTALGWLGKAVAGVTVAFVGWEIGRVIEQNDTLRQSLARLLPFLDQIEHMRAQAARTQSAVVGTIKDETINRATLAGVVLKQTEANARYLEAVDALMQLETIRQGQWNKSIEAQKAAIAAELALGRITQQTANERLAALGVEERSQAVAKARVDLDGAIARVEQQVQKEIAATGYTMAELATRLKANEEGFKAYAREVGLSAATVNAIEKEVAKYTKGQAASQKATEQAAEAMKQYTDGINKVGREISVGGVLDKMHQMRLELMAASQYGGVATEQLKRYTDQIDAWLAAGYDVGPMLMEWRLEHFQLKELLVPTSQILKTITENTLDLGPAMRQSGDDIVEFNTILDEMHRKLKGISTINFRTLGEQVDLSKLWVPPPTLMQKLAPGFRDLADALGKDFAAQLGEAIATGEELGEALKNIGKDLAPKLAAGLTAMIPLVGQYLAPIVGGLVERILGPTKTQVAGREADKQIDTLKAKLVGPDGLYGSFEELQAAALELGLTFSDVWGRRGVDGLKLLDERMVEFNKRQTETKLRMDAIKDSLGRLQGAVQVFGGVAPAALRPTILALLEMDGLTADMRTQLEGLAQGPSWQTLQAQAEALGIDLAALGPAFHEAKITDTALGYARTLGQLADTSSDMGLVLVGMQDELSKLYQDAVAQGVALPETLRPYMETLIEMGGLVDENGEKVEDLNAVAFKEIEDEALTAVVTILEEIKELLERGLPDAARAGATGIQDEFNRHPVIVPYSFQQTGGIERPEGPEEPRPEIGLQGGTHGQYVDWGAGTAVTLHGKERVMPEGEIGGEGGAPIHITVISKLDGREVARNQIKYIPRELSLAGV